MKTAFRLFPFLLCLWLLSSSTQVKATQQSDFDFLAHYKNDSLVEDSLALAESSAGLLFSTLVNLGLWYGACKTIGLVSGLSHGFETPGAVMQTPEAPRGDFCLQLSWGIVLAELALAGSDSPWPHEQVWWQSMRMLGMGFAAYGGYAVHNSFWAMPVATLQYLAVEAGSHRVGSAVLTRVLRMTDNMDIDPAHYDFAQYRALFSTIGLMVGLIFYEASIKGGLNSGWTRIVFTLSTFITTTGLMTRATSQANMNARLEAEPSVNAAMVSGVLTGAAALAMSLVLTGVTTATRTSITVIAIVSSGAVTEGVAGINGLNTTETKISTVIIYPVVVIAAVETGQLLTRLVNIKTASDSSIITTTAYGLASAFVFTLASGLSGYLVYGNALEKSLAEIARGQLTKLYYFSTH